MRCWPCTLVVALLFGVLAVAEDKNAGKAANKEKPADKTGDKSGAADKAADKEKSADKGKASDDSPIVKKTREKLEAKITVEFVDEQISNVVKELGEKLEVSIRILDKSIPLQKRINYKAEDKAARVILDEMLKPDGLGYVIHRKENANDRYEGYLDIVTGDQRGDPTPPGKDKAAKTQPKTAGKTEAEKPAKTEVTDADRERLANNRLKQAKQFLEDGQKEEAIDFLESVVKRYPATKAAEEAKTLLEKLKK